MNAAQRKEAIDAVATIGQLLLSSDWSYLDLVEIARAKRQLDRLLHAAVSIGVDSKLSLVSSRSVPVFGSVRLHGTTNYCRGCGFAFDSSNQLAAAPHASH